MFSYFRNSRSQWPYKLLVSFISYSFLASLILPPGITSAAEPQIGLLGLPMPGSMVLKSEGYTPACLKGVKIDPQNPLKFDFIIDSGKDALTGQALEEEANKLIKYFLATLTIPEDDLWVNLSPYESDRIIPEGFGLTEMGRDLLAQDYMLKQLVASLIYPEDDLGQEFWQRVYDRAAKEYGTTNIPINTFNKVWIVPQDALVVEHNGSAFVVDSHLKVMLEEDYLALESNLDNQKLGTTKITQDYVKTLSKVSSDVVREILLPEIEKEVNEGENFAKLRQIYNSMILATWYKQNLRATLLGQVYVNKGKIKGVDVEDHDIKQKIYEQYLEAFRKGVYSYIREDYDMTTKTVIPRKYFSGGFDASQVSSAIRTVDLQNVPLSSSLRARINEGLNTSSPVVQVSTVLAENPSEALAAQGVVTADAVEVASPISAAEQSRVAAKLQAWLNIYGREDRTGLFNEKLPEALALREQGLDFEVELIPEKWHEGEVLMRVDAGYDRVTTGVGMGEVRRRIVDEPEKINVIAAGKISPNLGDSVTGVIFQMVYGQTGQKKSAAKNMFDSGQGEEFDLARATLEKLRERFPAYQVIDGEGTLLKETQRSESAVLSRFLEVWRLARQGVDFDVRYTPAVGFMRGGVILGEYETWVSDELISSERIEIVPGGKIVSSPIQAEPLQYGNLSPFGQQIVDYKLKHYLGYVVGSGDRDISDQEAVALLSRMSSDIARFIQEGKNLKEIAENSFPQLNEETQRFIAYARQEYEQNKKSFARIMADLLIASLNEQETSRYDETTLKAKPQTFQWRWPLLDTNTALEQIVRDRVTQPVSSAIEISQAAQQIEAQTGNEYWDGMIKTTPIERPFRASRKEDVPDITEISEEEGLRLERIAAESLINGEGYLSTMIAGASSRMNTGEAPEEVRQMVAGREILSKAAVPIGVVDGEVITYLDAFGISVSRLLAELDAVAKQAGRTSKAYDNIVGFLSNDQYRAEQDAILEERGYYGLPEEQVRFYHQPLGAKYVGTVADVEALHAGGKFGSEEAYQDALGLAQEVEATRRENKAAVLLDGERDPLGHGEFFHQMIESGELVHLINTGKKWIYVRNIDNYAGKFDRVFLRLLGQFLDRGLDAEPEVSPRAPGLKGGSLIVMEDNGSQQLAEDPNIEATNKARGETIMSPTDSYWFNNAAGFFGIDYIINIYKQEGQSAEEFVEELRNASAEERLAIAQRGRAKFPKLIDPKPAKTRNAVAVKIETNMWQSTGVVDDNMMIKAAGVRSGRNFPIMGYPQMSQPEKTQALANLRFLATKQWDRTAEDKQKAREKMESDLGRAVTDEELAITLETYEGNKLLAEDILSYIKTAEVVSPGVLDQPVSSAIEISQAAQQIEAQTGNEYWDGMIKTTPIERPFRASRKEDVPDITEISEEEGLRLERIAAESLINGEGYLSTMIAGASSRMNTGEAPEEVRQMVAGREILSKAAVPIGVVDGEVITYLDAFGISVSRLLAELDAVAKQAGRTSKAYDNIVGFLSNDQYRAEQDAILEERGYYGLPEEQVRFYHQPLGAKYVGTVADVEALHAGGKFGSEEAYQDALGLAQEVEATRRENKAAVLLDGERDPLGHGEFFHQMIESGELVHLINTGKKWIYVRNIDNYAGKFDRVFLRLLGQFLDRGLDAEPEVSPRAPGLKGGSLIVMEDNGSQQLAEDPNIEATNKARGETIMSPTDSYWFNNAAGFFGIDYIINIYKQEGQSAEEFVEELRNASAEERLAIAQRGRAKFPKLIDPKPAKTRNAVAVKIETNMWQSTGVVDDNMMIKAAGVRSGRNFPIMGYPQMSQPEKTQALANLRFLATKQWDRTAEDKQKAREKMESDLGRAVTDEELAITLETYEGNKLLAEDILSYIKTAEVVSPGVLDQPVSSATQYSQQLTQTMMLSLFNNLADKTNLMTLLSNINGLMIYAGTPYYTEEGLAEKLTQLAESSGERAALDAVRAQITDLANLVSSGGINANVITADATDITQSITTAAAVSSPVTIKKILIVDDTDEVRDLNRDIFDTIFAGAEIITAVNGEEGLKAFQANPDIDMVVTDLDMPKMNGEQMARAIRAERDVPVVLISGNNNEVDRLSQVDEATGLKSGIFAQVIQKPYQLSSIIALKEQLASSPITAGPSLPLNMDLGDQQIPVSFTAQRLTTENLSSTTAIRSLLTQVDAQLRFNGVDVFSTLLEEYAGELDTKFMGWVLEAHPESEAARVVTQILEFVGGVYAQFTALLKEGKLRSQDGRELRPIEEEWQGINVIEIGGAVSNNPYIRRILEQKISTVLGDGVTLLPVLSNENQLVAEEAGVLGAALLVDKEQRRNKVVIGIDVGGTSAKLQGVQFDGNGDFVDFVGGIQRFTLQKDIAEVQPAEYYSALIPLINTLRSELQTQQYDVSDVLGMGHPGKKEADGTIAQESWPNRPQFFGVNPASTLQELLGGEYGVVWMNDAFAGATALYELSGERIANARILYIGPGTGLGAALLKTDSQGIARMEAGRDLHAQHDPYIGESLLASSPLQITADQKARLAGLLSTAEQLITRVEIEVEEDSVKIEQLRNQVAEVLREAGEIIPVGALAAELGRATPAPEALRLQAIINAMVQFELRIQELSGVTVSADSVTASSPLGGINLNPALLNLQIKRDNNGIPLPLPQQPVGDMNIEGFLPIIINITPIPSLPMLLGMAAGEEPARGVNRIQGEAQREEQQAPSQPAETNVQFFFGEEDQLSLLNNYN